MLRFITSNKNKFQEAQYIFSSSGFDINWTDKKYPELQADTVKDVVGFSLKHIPEENIFIEDSGLFIEVLNGFPGVYSSYVQKTIGNQGILKLLESEKSRDAYFLSVAGLKVRGKIHIFEGVVKGFITEEESGNGGFGYDPIFIPEHHDKTFAEDPVFKNKHSHRKKALQALIGYLNNRN